MHLFHAGRAFLLVALISSAAATTRTNELHGTGAPSLGGRQLQNECSKDTFPFVFVDASGEPVNGVAGEDGICTFPDSDCGAGESSSRCCYPREAKTGTIYMFIAFAFIFLQQFFVRKYFYGIYEKDPTLLENVRFDRTPAWLKNNCILKHFACVWKWGVWVGVAAMVTIPTFIKPSVQEHLRVSSRNALQSAEAFLIPYKEIFQFVEDIVNVKINYALTNGDLEGANKLVHLGIAASILSGLFASAVASILGAIPPVLRALTNPGLKNDLTLYPGCNIIEDTGDDNDVLLPYWMIEVWKFPGAQVAMVLAGFLYGALEYNTMGWIVAIGLSMLPIIWFSCISKAAIEPLLLLAWGEFAVPYCTVALVVCYMLLPLGHTIRDNTGVTLSFTSLFKGFKALFRVIYTDGSQQPTEVQSLLDNEGDGGVSDEGSTTKALVKEGLMIMGLDLGVQLAKSLTIYLALTTDASTAYQLTALDSYLPSYGMAYATGISFCVKIIGPIFLSMKEYEVFFRFARVSVFVTLLMIPLIVGATVPYIDGLAKDSGMNACEYAGDDACVPFFTNVFGENASGGHFTLYHSYRAFAYGSCVESIYIVTRALMLTCLEFAFVLKSTGVALIFYTIVIIVVSLVEPFAKEAISYWIAMTVPQVVLIILFLGRLHTLFRRMVRGEVNGAMRARFRQKVLGSRPAESSA